MVQRGPVPADGPHGVGASANPGVPDGQVFARSRAAGWTFTPLRSIQNLALPKDEIGGLIGRTPKGDAVR
jgi:hypothetical protein